MNFAMIFYVFGWIAYCEGVLLLVPLLVAIQYGEALAPFVWSILICAVIGTACLLRKPKSRVFYLREGFVITSLSWLLMSLIGTLPFLISGAIPNFVDALFETVSGFTTTGASILGDVEALPKGILFWRSLTHWIGGMGVLVFLLTLLPKASGSYTNLMKAESPGPMVEKLVPKLRDTALILYGIYIALMLMEIMILRLLKMPLFDSVTLSLGTAGTGGFGIRNDSLASYTLAQQNVVALFMVLFGINFNFYFYLLLGKAKKACAIEEVRWYLVIVGAAVFMVSLNIMRQVGGFFPALQQSFFQVSSLISSTGYATTNFDLWPNFSKTVLVMAMMVGACAGSTGGGFKVSRVLILMKDIKCQLQRVLQPQRVCHSRMDGKVLDKDTVDTANAYLAAYILVFLFSWFLLSLDGLDILSNFTAVLATLNNIGPGLSAVGPAQNYALYSWGAKLLLTFDMLIGRLELFPVLVLFSPATWKKH